MKNAFLCLGSHNAVVNNRKDDYGIRILTSL